MKQIKLLGIASIAVILFAAACTKANEEALKPADTGSSCDTANMQYSTGVLPILQANCYSCHGNNNREGGINLSDYSAVKIKVDDGQLIGAITHSQGFAGMPLNQPQLSACDINKIKSWINSGAQNN